MDNSNTKKQPQLATVFRWIAVPVVFILSQGVVRFLWDIFGSNGWFITTDTLNEIRNQSTLSGQYFWGAIYIFVAEFASIVVSIYVSAYTAPNHRRAVLITTSVLWLLLTIFGSITTLLYFPTSTLGDLLVTGASGLAGFVITIYVLMNSKQIATDIND